jgi:small subunit ribosomal protein S4
MVKKLKKKYETPSEGWDGDRIEDEKGLMEDYGLSNKQEIYRTQSQLRSLRRQARELIGTDQQEQKQQVVSKTHELGLVREDAGLEDILTLNATDFLDRRLQTTIHRRGYADTPMEARQLVTHGMVRVDGRRIDVPGYMLTQEEESQIEVSEPEETEEESEETQE